MSFRCWLAAAFAALVVTCSVAGSPKHAPSTVKVSRRLWYGICTGVCPDYDVVVTSLGRVDVRSLMAGKTKVQYRVAPSAAARFMSWLRPYRKQGFHRTRTTCDHHLSDPDARLLVHVREVEITWHDNGGTSRLIACDTEEDRPILTAIKKAFAEVSLWEAATRMPSDYQLGSDEQN